MLDTSLQKNKISENIADKKFFFKKSVLASVLLLVEGI